MAKQFLPVLLVRMGLFRGLGLAEGVTHPLQARADGAALLGLSGKGECCVLGHAPVGLGLERVGWRRAEIKLPTEFQDVIQPFLFRSGRDEDAVAGERRQRLVHGARHRILDRYHRLDVGKPVAQFRAHQIAAVGMRPQRHADIHL